MIPLETTVFTIGKSPKSSLRLKGLFLRAIEATIVAEANGGHRLIEADGAKKILHNGEKIADGGVILQPGSTIMVGKHKLVFLLTSAGGAS